MEEFEIEREKKSSTLIMTEWTKRKIQTNKYKQTNKREHCFKLCVCRKWVRKVRMKSYNRDK